MSWWAQIIAMVGLAFASWAIAGIITVSYMKTALGYVTRDIKATNEHLRHSDSRHEELLKDFNEHRIEMARRGRR